MVEFDVEGWAGTSHGSQHSGLSMGQWWLRTAQSMCHLVAMYGDQMGAKSNQCRITPEQHQPIKATIITKQ